jgi:glycosyltransferase involved in cell wall biosynthesis
MNLGIFFSPGDSLNNFNKAAQADRFIEFFLKPYSKNFKKVYLFSYEDENWDLPENVILVKNKLKIHRLIYGIFLPLIHFQEVNDCNVVRGFGIASSISSLVLWKPFIFNWAYDYIGFVKTDRRYIYIPFYYLLERIAFWRATKVLIATKQKYKTLKGKKFFYFPNGVDLKHFQENPAKSAKLLFIGRFEHQKNLQFLFDSLGLLPKKYRQITTIGSGSQEADLKKWAKNNEVKVNFLKPIPNIKLAKFMQRFSIFLLPSFHEGIPKVLIEAMAVGLVPVVTNFPTAKDVVDTGVDGLIADFNKQEYADAVLKVSENIKLRQQFSRNAVKKIKKEFDLKKLTEKEIKILKNV